MMYVAASMPWLVTVNSALGIFVVPSTVQESIVTSSETDAS
ncbi:hypothetical protein [Streptomyces sp. NBC_00996]|nr:hypothetical protein OG390_28775 [Streptomyces sp. NBC_00996]